MNYPLLRMLFLWGTMLLVWPAAGQNAFTPYTETLPVFNLTFDLVPIPGGTYQMGSRSLESYRKDDEGPQHQETVEPFWMMTHEVTWNLYDKFVMLNTNAQQVAAAEKLPPGVDGVSRATPPYVDMSFGMGKDGYPATGMTNFAAARFCEWLTALTGHFYRLPTEAEWEYACRAGTTTAYSFGDDASRLSDYAWAYDNSNNKYQKVGQKKPNPWGLYDMHGNVAEWTLNQYTTDGYQRTQGQPWSPPTQLYPRTVRGGSWDDDPGELRSAARRGSSPKWKKRDPQVPKSLWWLTDASFVGFRVIRPQNPPPKSEWKKYWLEPIEEL
ncbi:Formylglycine-generating enzyme, required for sulfatase activity, contains SUMF1/FGE domain [Catalinimonas alkaloidigena]|uniref:Formylglycine-generating enzyme, required for sulfatase activity, contains SUMF1/FGE domain n=1 Tax=Catalinimonas alkaloidigena TaxID=1075417 RepID=A0A1G9ITJ9_9BACT|nr:formylglycine-generating enzyme family protein [Catalinimonas alkaloidigena]SDL28395.1 Formylglycine-generating enzyme, required for sulfatase activity, contains SUMF1/FGE domain [Catalinimonas alkaloidigena]